MASNTQLKGSYTYHTDSRTYLADSHTLLVESHMQHAGSCTLLAESRCHLADSRTLLAESRNHHADSCTSLLSRTCTMDSRTNMQTQPHLAPLSSRHDSPIFLQNTSSSRHNIPSSRLPNTQNKKPSHHFDRRSKERTNSTS